MALPKVDPSGKTIIYFQRKEKAAYGVNLVDPNTNKVTGSLDRITFSRWMAYAAGEPWRKGGSFNRNVVFREYDVDANLARERARTQDKLSEIRRQKAKAKSDPDYIPPRNPSITKQEYKERYADRLPQEKEQKQKITAAPPETTPAQKALALEVAKRNVKFSPKALELLNIRQQEQLAQVARPQKVTLTLGNVQATSTVNPPQRTESRTTKKQKVIPPQSKEIQMQTQSMEIQQTSQNYPKLDIRVRPPKEPAGTIEAAQPFYEQYIISTEPEAMRYFATKKVRESIDKPMSFIEAQGEFGRSYVRENQPIKGYSFIASSAFASIPVGIYSLASKGQIGQILYGATGIPLIKSISEDTLLKGITPGERTAELAGLSAGIYVTSKAGKKIAQEAAQKIRMAYEDIKGSIQQAQFERKQAQFERKLPKYSVEETQAMLKTGGIKVNDKDIQTTFDYNPKIKDADIVKRDVAIQRGISQQLKRIEAQNKINIIEGTRGYRLRTESGAIIDQPGEPSIVSLDKASRYDTSLLKEYGQTFTDIRNRLAAQKVLNIEVVPRPSKVSRPAPAAKPSTPTKTTTTPEPSTNTPTQAITVQQSSQGVRFVTTRTDMFPRQAYQVQYETTQVPIKNAFNQQFFKDSFKGFMLLPTIQTDNLLVQTNPDDERLKPSTREDMDIFLGYKQTNKPKRSSKNDLRYKSDIDQLQDSMYNFDNKRANIVSPDISQDQPQSEVPKSDTLPDITPILIPKTTTKTQVSAKPQIKTPEPQEKPGLSFGLEQPEKTSSTNIPTFYVQVREKGRFTSLNSKPLPPNKAVNLGADAVDNTSAAAFRLKKAGKSKSVPDDPTFYKRDKFYKKNNTYVEKSRNRIDTIGEIQGITVKGWIARRRGGIL